MRLLSPQLQAFIAVCEQGSVHAGADILHLTQTAVTQRIRNLEAQLGTSLFVRSRRGMQPTAEGEALLQYCHAVTALEGETLAKITGQTALSTVSLVITGPTSIMRSRIIPACTPILKQYPQTLIHFMINDEDSRHHALRQAKADFAVLQPHHITPEMRSKTLKPELYVLVGPKAWQQRSLEDIITHERIIDFEPGDQMTLTYLKHYHLASLARPERYFVNNPDELVDLISAQVGYSALTWEFFEMFKDTKPITLLDPDEHVDFPIKLVWFDRPVAPHYFQAIIDAVQ
jgi:LysR family transcriptional regulator (chromosome initiation inhibitor)